MNEHLQAVKEDILDKLRFREDELRANYGKEDRSLFQRTIEAAFRSVIRENKISLNRHEQEELLSEVITYFLGFGPIEKLLKDDGVTEIMINGPHQVYVERKGNLELTDITFNDEAQVSYLIEKIISPVGRRISEFEPFVDARLNDGSRVNIVRSPVSRIGPLLTIRKFSYNVLRMDDLIKLGSLNSSAAEFLKACVISRMNILISGGAGTGKTTFLNALIDFIPENERLITIEDTRELIISRKHTVPMETRPFNIEGKGEISIRDLFKNALHMRPDRIIAGEVRGGEVLDMIQAMSTGHEGSMTTLHASSPSEALDRLEILALMGSSNMSGEVARRQIIGAVDLVVYLTRFPDGRRRVTQISEVLKSKEYSMQDIFVFDEESGALKPAKVKPNFYNKLNKVSGYRSQDF
ncbi:MAG: CpaF family protein [Candidatus Omnitrophica bacterium]|nr:CpaF family protein [Candidatus Omnitrophota bacterium]MDD5660711.1 CpaF family protein [Candidatus Omnitrophota bacterium]